MKKKEYATIAFSLYKTNYHAKTVGCKENQL
jgi:hypothetical protein